LCLVLNPLLGETISLKLS